MAFKKIETNIAFLFREVAKDYTPTLKEKIFYKDKNSGQIKDSKPSIFPINRSWEYYAFTLDTFAEQRGFTKRLEELDNSISISLSLNYKFKLLNTLDIEFVKDTIRKGTAMEVLQILISQWLEEYAGDNPGFLNTFFHTKDVLIQFINQRALSKGILLDTVILDEYQSERDLSLTGRLDVKTYDYKGKTSINYNIELGILKNKKIKAQLALKNKERLCQTVEKSIRELLLHQKINLHTLYHNANTQVSEWLEKELEGLLDLDGLELIFIDLEVSLTNIPPKRKRYDIPQKCTTKDGHEIAVNHILILTLTNLGDFYRGRIGDLDAWVLEELGKQTEDYIFEKNFTDLVVHFDDTEIKERMKVSLQEIGYEIKQFTSSPDIKKIIPPQVELQLGEEYEYATSRDDVKVKLYVSINGEIIERSKLNWFLNPSTKSDVIIRKVKDIVIHEIRQFMHKLFPEQFYMRFESSEGNKTNLSPAEELIIKLNDILKEKFGILNATIICKPLETELIKKFKSLQGIAYPVLFENKLGEISYEIRFNVLDVDKNGWHTFKTKCDALKNRDTNTILKDIAQNLKHYLESRLDIWETDFISVKHEEFTNHLDQYLKEGVQIIVEEFGLIISASKSKNRKPNSVERGLKEDLKQKLLLEDEKRKVNYESQKLFLVYQKEKLKTLIEHERRINGEYPEDEEQITRELDEIGKRLLADNKESNIKKLETGVSEATKLLNAKNKDDNN